MDRSTEEKGRQCAVKTSRTRRTREARAPRLQETPEPTPQHADVHTLYARALALTLSSPNQPVSSSGRPALSSLPPELAQCLGPEGHTHTHTHTHTHAEPPLLNMHNEPGTK